MDFENLLKPYSEDGRTVSGQIKWLLKSVPQSSADYAMSAVYKRLELGEKFENGHELDQELKKVAKEYYESELVTQMTKRIEQIARNLDSEWNALGKMKKIWEVIRNRA